jgi:hypothetical protein
LNDLPNVGITPKSNPHVQKSDRHQWQREQDFAPVLAGRRALRFVTAPRRGSSIVQLFFFRCAVLLRFLDLNDRPIRVPRFVRSVASTNTIFFGHASRTEADRFRIRPVATKQ